MIIEDDLIIAENLKENLEELGYQVIGVASKFSEARILFKAELPDLCIVDIHLKNSINDGISTISLLNNEDKIPIILLTSFHDKDSRNRAKQINVSAYLVKPASKEQIAVAIDMALSTFYKKKGKNKSVLSDINSFFTRVNNKYEKIRFSNIKFIKAEGSYCDVYCEDYIVTISVNLKSILAQLLYPKLMKCHRSYAINIDHVEAMSDISFFIYHNGKQKEIPISDSHKKNFDGFFQRIKTD